MLHPASKTRDMPVISGSHKSIESLHVGLHDQQDDFTSYGQALLCGTDHGKCPCLVYKGGRGDCIIRRTVLRHKLSEEPSLYREI